MQQTIGEDFSPGKKLPEFSSSLPLVNFLDACALQKLMNAGKDSGYETASISAPDQIYFGKTDQESGS
jgi:hypothetical protein